MGFDGPAVSCVRDLGAVASEWDALVATQPVPSPFARTWWLEAMAAGLPASARPCHLLVRGGDRLIGGIALAEDRLLGVRRYRFLGQGVLAPDHLDLLAAPGAEQQVVSAFRAWFAGPGTRLLHLDGVDDTALLCTAVAGRWLPIEAAPYAPLPGTGAEFVAQLSASFRRNVRRSAKPLTAEGFAHRQVPPAETREALAAFWDLHRARGDRARLVAHRDLLTAAVEAGVRRGECRIDVLDGPGGTIAAAVSFEVAGRLSLYQVTRSMQAEHAGAGTVLLASLIEDAAASDCHEVDLLRGEEAYKAHFARATRPMLALEAAHGSPARVVGRLRQAARSARRRVAASV